MATVSSSRARGAASSVRGGRGSSMRGNGRSASGSYERERHGSGAGQERREKSASELALEAKTLTKNLDQLLATRDPWDREVESLRNKIRECHRSIHFSHPTSHNAQSIDHLWISTSHVLIARYRTLISSLDKELSTQPHGHVQGQDNRRGSSGGARGGRQGDYMNQRHRGGRQEIRKILTRFRQFLCSEQTFYRGLITFFVESFGLAKISSLSSGEGDHRQRAAPGSVGTGTNIDVEAYLDLVGIPITSKGDGQGLLPSPATATATGQPDRSRTPSQSRTITLPHEEALKKVGLIHKALVCLGDLERYKEQYGPEREKKANATPSAGLGPGTSGSGAQVPLDLYDEDAGEVFSKAKKYYEVARGLLPDNGNPSNQLAVIATYTQDNFTAIYHYHRALACSQPFQTARQNLHKILRKSLQEWQASPQAARVGFPAVEATNFTETLKREGVLLQAYLTASDDLTGIDAFVKDHSEHLQIALSERQVPAEGIVKGIAAAIACHWDSRMQQCNNPGLPEGHTDQLRESAALKYLLGIGKAMVLVADDEIKDGLGDSRLTALDQDLDAEEAVEDSALEDSVSDLYVNVTAVLRRLLPALRLFSKWLKANTTVLSRRQERDVAEFWEAYSLFLLHAEALFPLERLPHLTDPLEEDVDFRGFSPLKRGMLDNAIPVGKDAEGSEGGNGVEGHHREEVHPNEEQLMRISDLLCDGKLIMQSDVPTTSRSNLAARVADIGHHLQRSFGEDRRQTISASDPPAGLQAGLPFLPPGQVIAKDDIEAAEVASISTATEDDPVNLAMRASLTDGSSVADSDDRPAFTEDDEEEEIMWPVRPGRQSSTPLREDTNAPVTPTLRPAGEARQSFGSGPSTASDLLHGLMTGNLNQTPPQGQSPPIGKPGASPLSNTASPILFGGGGFPSSSSIWTRDVNELDGWNAGGSSPAQEKPQPPDNRNLASSLFPPHPT